MGRLPDFTTVNEAPRKRFAPLSDAKQQVDTFWTVVFSILLFVAIAVAVVIHLFLQRRERRHMRERRWKRVREICLERGLDEKEIEVLLQALHVVNPPEPDRGVISEMYFNSLVAPEIVRCVGEEQCTAIRNRLFFRAKEERAHVDKGFGGTHDLVVGQKMRAHVKGIAGTFACTVINNQEAHFVITLPAAISGNEAVRAGAVLEGFVQLEGMFYSFESTILEILTANVQACKLNHTTELKQTHRRQFTRVHVIRTIVFRHLPADTMAGKAIGFSSVDESQAATYEGVVQDLSVGGCSLISPQPRGFEVGDFVQFDFHLLEDEEPHTLLSQIVHVSPPPGSARGCMLHLQFLGVEDEALASLTRTVHSLLREGDEDESVH